MTNTSIIDAFLAASLRAIRASEVAKWDLPDETRWDEVWSRIEYHGIPFLLHSKSHQLDGWPPLLIDRMAEEARLVILWETTHHAVVAKLIQELDQAEIPSILMKGTALAYSLHDEPATRRRGDTDLLIHPDYKAQTCVLLRDLGWYRKADPHGLYYQEGWLHDSAGFFRHSVDLHWEPSDRPTLQHILPIEEFFADPVPVTRFGKGALRPNPALMILHATINQKWHAQHGYDSEAGRLKNPRRLIWSVDFDLLVRSMDEADWQRLTDLCDRHGVGVLVGEALRGMQEDLHTDLRESTLVKFESQRIDPSLQKYLSDSDSLKQFWIDLRRSRSWKQRRQLLTMRGLPPRDHLVEKYPDSERWPTVLLQGRMLLETAGRAVRRAIS